MDDNILIDAKNAREYLCSVYDCCGNEVRKERISLENLLMVKGVPVNGTVILTAV
jgi:hypothetical protein